MLKATFAGLLAHKLRLSLTALAIVLGVAFVCATLILSNGLQAGFDNIFKTSGTQVSVVVRGHLEQGGSNGGFADAHRPVPASLLQTVRGVDGVTEAEGIVFRAGASLLDPSGKPYATGGGPPEFATDWIPPGPLSPYHLLAGAPPAAADQVVIDAVAARTHHISLGDRISYVFNGGPKQSFTVSGITGYGSSDNLQGASISLFQLETVQRVLNLQGEFDSIEVAAQSGTTAVEMRDRIAKSLPGYAEAVTGADAQQEQISGIDSFFSILRTILLVFALVALFVGSFIIVNTFNILIAQRTRELALLRALGASRAQVFRLVLIEALVVGAVGSLVGCFAGLGMAHLLYSTLSSVGGGLPKADLSLDGGTFALGMGLGVAITVAASVLPGRRASRVAPVEAIREATDTAAPMTRGRILIGALLTLAGAVLIGVGLFSGSSNIFYFLGAGALIGFIGIAMLAPLTVLPVAGTLGMPVQTLRGTPGKLARLNAIRAPRRTAATAAALMIGVSLVVGIAVLTESAKASTDAAVKGSISADYIVLSTGGQGFINIATVDALAKDPSFATVTDVRSGTILVDNSSTQTLALDPATYQATYHLDPASGDVNSLSKPNTIFVDQKQASDHGWSVGDTISVNFPQKGDTVPMRIGCIFNINALASGYVISTQTYDTYFTEKQAFVILIKDAPQVSFSAAGAALNHDLAAFPTLKAYNTTDFLALQAQQLDQLTSIINVFLVMAIIIASLGIVNTMALSIIERTRELGLLRAIGLTRSQTRTMVRWESILIAVLGMVLGAVIGVILGIAVVRALGPLGVGHIAIPVGPLVTYLLAAIVIGFVAAILPGRRAARLKVLEAIASE